VPGTGHAGHLRPACQKQPERSPIDRRCSARHKPVRNSSIYGRTVALSLLLGREILQQFLAMALSKRCMFLSWLDMDCRASRGPFRSRAIVALLG